MILVVFFSYSFALSTAYSFFPLGTPGCQPIPSNFTLCNTLGYTQMYLPNLLNQESVTEILYELPRWESLLSLQCHENDRLLLCSILAPVCLQQATERSKLVSFDDNQDSALSVSGESKRFLFPCRTLCETVKRSCEPVMIERFGYRWPSMIDCDQYPDKSDLCVSHSSMPSTTRATTTTTTSPKRNLCSMCQSHVSVSDLLSDYCQSSIVVRTRPIKISPTSRGNLIFANKHKARYFKRPDDVQTKFDFSVRYCPCIKLHAPTILFISSNGELTRFIAVRRNSRVFQRFRNTIVLRKPRCQRQ